MTLRASVTAAELDRAVNETGRWVFRVRVKRRTDGAWTDLTSVAGGDWTLGISTDEDSPDKPQGGFEIRFLRAADGHSLAPGVSASSLNRDAASVFRPLAYAGRLVEVDCANLAPGETRDSITGARWHPWLSGDIARSAWPDDEVVTTCRNQDAILNRVQIEDEEERGAADPGVPMPTEFQGLLDRWRPGTPLVTIGDPDQGIGPYKTPRGSLGAFLLAQAQRIGWDARYRWNDAAGARRFTLYLPPRDKVTPDLTLSASQVFEVPGLEVSDEFVRNAARVDFPDAATGQLLSWTGEDPDSIAEYGRQPLRITEGPDSLIRNQAQAAALGTSALSDLAQPPTDKRVRIPFLPWLELHHMVRIGADGGGFDYDQDYSVLGVSHTVDAESGASTTAALRGGSPVGMYYAWHKRKTAGGEYTAADRELIDFRHYDTPTHRVFTWINAPGVAEVWATTPLVTAADPLPDAAYGTAKSTLSPIGLVTEYAVPWPKEGDWTLGYVAGGQFDADGQFLFGSLYPMLVPGTAAPFDFAVTQAVSPDGLTETLTITVDDLRGVLAGVEVYETLLDVTTGPVAATHVAGPVWSYVHTLDEQHVKTLRVVATRTDGGSPRERVYTSDFNTVPSPPLVREVRTVDAVALYVDSDDTDAASQWVEVEVEGLPGEYGPEQAVPQRGSDPRFGLWPMVATDAEQRLRFRAKNSAGVAGPYRDVRVEPYGLPTAGGVSVEDRKPQPVIRARMEVGTDELRLRLADGTLVDSAFRAAGTDTPTADYDTDYLVYVVSPALATEETREYYLTASKAGAVGEREVWRGVVTGPSPDTVDVVAEEVGDDSLTLIPIALLPGDVVQFATRVGAEPAFGPWVTVSGPTYAQTVARVPKHGSDIAYRVLRNGAPLVQRIVRGFDLGTEANVRNATAADAGDGTALVTCAFDTDTGAPGNFAQWSFDQATWTPFAVDAQRNGSFSVTQTDATQVVYVRALAADGTPGPSVPVDIPARNPAAPGWQVLLGPSLDGLHRAVLLRARLAVAAVTAVQYRITIGTDAPTSWTAPTRTTGQAAVVDGGILGPDEWEIDALLDATRTTLVEVRAFYAGRLEPIGVPVPPLDRNEAPGIVSLDILDGSKAKCTGDDDTRSWLAYPSDIGSGAPGYWSEQKDGSTVTFDLAARVPAGGSVNVTFVARNRPTATAGNPGTLTVTETRMLRDPAAPAGPTVVVDATAPTGSGASAYVVGVALQCANLPADITGWTLRVMRNVNTGSGWQGWTDVSAQLSPAPTVSATLTNHAIGVSPSAAYYDPAGSGYVSHDYRAELVDAAATIRDSNADTASWPYPTPADGREL